MRFEDRRRAVAAVAAVALVAGGAFAVGRVSVEHPSGDSFAVVERLVPVTRSVEGRCREVAKRMVAASAEAEEPAAYSVCVRAELRQGLAENGLVCDGGGFVEFDLVRFGGCAVKAGEWW